MCIVKGKRKVIKRESGHNYEVTQVIDMRVQ